MKIGKTENEKNVKSIQESRDIVKEVLRFGVSESQKIGMRLQVSLPVENGSTNVLDNIGFFAYITSANVTVGTAELTTVGINFTVDGDFTDAFNNEV